MRKFVSLNSAKDLLKNGDILLFRGQGTISKLIQRAGEGPYSHVGVVAIWDDIIECVEFQEQVGGRSANLDVILDKSDGIIDVYRVISPIVHSRFNEYTDAIEHYEIKLNEDQIINDMKVMSGLPYGWKRIFWILLHKVPFFRLFYDMNKLTDESLVDLPIYPVCSTIVAHVFARQGFYLVKNRSTEYTEPSDIGKSAILDYLFTLIN